MNPYLKSKRAAFDALKTTIEGVQTRAADEKRDMTEDELKSVKEQGEQARKLADEIEMLHEVETRNAKVAGLGAAVDEQVRTSTTTAQDRDPGHYRSEVQGGKHSFFSDLVRSREDDVEAKTRLSEHTRALSSSSAGTGILPPKWMTDEFAAIARQTRRVANQVRQIPLGNDPRPITLQKQTGATTVATQSAENATSTWPDTFNTGVDTVTPSSVSGGAQVSRQLLDGASPAIDQLIYGDLIAAYNSGVEARVCASMVAAAGTATTAYATESAYTTAVTGTTTGVPLVKNLRQAITSVRNLRKLAPDLVIAAVARYGTWLDITDAQGRPLFPVADYGTVNVVGQGSPDTDGRVLGMNIIATDGLPYQTYPESILVARSQDTLLFESGLLQFRYDQPLGPETIRLGVWGYVGVLTRYSGASVQRLQITAA